jgi:hypothetical protein
MKDVEGGDVLVVKKRLLAVALAAFCMGAAFLLALPTNSAVGTDGYDPWFDLDDNGKINIMDVTMIARAFGSSGTPINKTAVLLDLQDKISSLNASLMDLESRTATLELANSMTSYSVGIVTTTSTGAVWVDMDGTSVTTTLEKTSDLLIFFSAMLSVNPTDDSMRLRALVDGEAASPSDVQVIKSSSPYDTWTCQFYKPSVAPGTYTVKIQWWVSGGTGYAQRRVLTVMASRR